MPKKNLNFYYSALAITVVGAAATLVIVRAAHSLDSFVYTESYFEAEAGTGVD